MSCVDDICSKSFFGLDSFDFVNNIIKSILYPKPNSSHNQIRKLNKIPNIKLFYITNKISSIKTCVCEVYPSYYQNQIKSNKIIIFSHGNGCDILTIIEYLKYLADKLGIIVVSYDYPQYGLSKGDLNEFSCYQSLSNVINHYYNFRYENKILLVGQSLGTGIVIDYISKNTWSNPVILISPYKSIPKVVLDYNFIECLISKNKFDSYTKILNTKCEIKIFHGKSDNIIKYEHSLTLYNLMPNKNLQPKFFDNIGHNDILDVITIDDYMDILNLIL